MAKKTSPLLPATDELLRQLGRRLRLARLRRKLTAKQVAERSGMSPITLRNVESGESGVTIGAYIAVMQILGIEKDFNFLAQKDELGRELQDAQLERYSEHLLPKAINTVQPASKIKQSANVSMQDESVLHLPPNKKTVRQHKNKKPNNLVMQEDNQYSKTEIKSAINLAKLIEVPHRDHQDK